MNILIVDNDDTLRSFCFTVLSQSNRTIYTADNESYWQYFNREITPLNLSIINVNPYDVIPSIDIVNSLMTYNPDIQVLLLSIDVSCKAIGELMHRGCMHITIPFSVNTLITKVDSIQSLIFV
jgi:DNA-binding NtrC family response regulator